MNKKNKQLNIGVSKAKIKEKLLNVIIALSISLLVISITGNIYIDKVLFKVLSITLYSIATILVGFFYEHHIIKNAREVSKWHVIFYIILCVSSLAVMILQRDIVMSLLQFVLGVIAYVLMWLILIGIAIGIQKISECFTSTSRHKNSKVYNAKDRFRCINCSCTTIEETKQNVVCADKNKYTIDSLTELWLRSHRNQSGKALYVTNINNKNMEWVRLYIPPYNGHFVGDLKMSYCDAVLNDREIYYVDDKAWRILTKDELQKYKLL